MQEPPYLVECTHPSQQRPTLVHSAQRTPRATWVTDPEYK